MSKKKILIIDDEKGFSEILQINLSKDGEYEVAVENDSSKSITAVKSFKPDLVLLDVLMPRTGGLAVLEHLKMHPETALMPVIMLTALGGNKTKFISSKLHCDDYIEKTTDLKEIKQRIAKVLNK
jgi:DNA-binding response OmpR family regulator